MLVNWELPIAVQEELEYTDNCEKNKYSKIRSSISLHNTFFFSIFLHKLYLLEALFFFLRKNVKNFMKRYLSTINSRNDYITVFTTYCKQVNLAKQKQFIFIFLCYTDIIFIQNFWVIINIKVMDNTCIFKTWLDTARKATVQTSVKYLLIKNVKMKSFGLILKWLLNIIQIYVSYCLLA